MSDVERNPTNEQLVDYLVRFIESADGHGIIVTDDIDNFVRESGGDFNVLRDLFDDKTKPRPGFDKCDDGFTIIGCDALEDFISDNPDWVNKS